MMMIRTLSAVLAALLLSSAAHAATLRSQALVSGEIVTVGDLVDGAGERAATPLFRAPDPGQTGAVPAATIVLAARRAGVDVSAGALTEISVTRASREITAAEIKAAIAVRVADATGAGVDAIDVTLDEDASVHVDAGASGLPQLTRFVSDPRSNRFEAAIDVAGRPASAQPIRVSGTAVEMVETATLSRAFNRGEIVTKADVKTVRVPRAQAGDVTLPSELVGLAAKRTLRAEQPLRSGDLMRPQHVERGSFVTLVYAGAGVSLSLKAKAMAAGAAGDVIAVQNIQSKRVVNGVVTGPSEVTVTAAPTAVARR